MQVYIALGSNLGRREENLHQALRALTERIGALCGYSSFFETLPAGFASAHRFLNAVALYESTLTPEALLAVTQDIERRLGRTAKTCDGAYADRPIDLDLLAVGDCLLDTPQLTLPHPRLHERRFVLEPLVEIAPDWQHPRLGRTARQLLDALNAARFAEADAPTPELASALQRLLPQLSDSAPTFDTTALKALLAAPNTHLYTLSDETDTVQGTFTLVCCPSPTGTKCWLEDVVVDAAARGRGYGRQLMAHAIDEARRLGAQSLCLTSRPSRTAANALYQACGLHRRETNVYILPL